jgi:hypothetical protein
LAGGWAAFIALSYYAAKGLGIVMQSQEGQGVASASLILGIETSCDETAAATAGSWQKPC